MFVIDYEMAGMNYEGADIVYLVQLGPMFKALRLYISTFHLDISKHSPL